LFSSLLFYDVGRLEGGSVGERVKGGMWVKSGREKEGKL
jgi:hypothetical protein